MVEELTVPSFRSAPPCGGRLSRGPHRPDVSHVSIRAPVRGATARFAFTSNHTECFDPRPRAGGDRSRLGRRHGRRVSIRAPVRGATSGRVIVTMRTQCFDPRPRAGGDPLGPKQLAIPLAFRSAPPCGGRLLDVVHVVADQPSFDPRPRAGGDDHRHTIEECYLVSIRAPVRGATAEDCPAVLYTLVSIRAPVRGATRRSRIVSTGE